MLLRWRHYTDVSFHLKLAASSEPSWRGVSARPTPEEMSHFQTCLKYSRTSAAPVLPAATQTVMWSWTWPPLYRRTFEKLPFRTSHYIGFEWWAWSGSHREFGNFAANLQSHEEYKGEDALRLMSVVDKGRLAIREKRNNRQGAGEDSKSQCGDTRWFQIKKLPTRETNPGLFLGQFFS